MSRHPLCEWLIVSLVLAILYMHDERLLGLAWFNGA